MKDNEWGTRFWSPSPQPPREPQDDDVLSIHLCPVCERRLRHPQNLKLGLKKDSLLQCDGCGWWTILK